METKRRYLKHFKFKMSVYFFLPIFFGFLISFPIKTINSIEVFKNNDAYIDIGGRLQVMGELQKLHDPYRDSQRYYGFLKQARLNLKGAYKDVDFGFQAAFGGEEAIDGKPSGTILSPSLLDLYGDLKIIDESMRFRFGQYKVPFGREVITDSKDLIFVSRSINFLPFVVNRDVGGTLHGSLGVFKYGVGIFTGGGKNVPQRYLPETFGSPMGVLRIGIDNGVDKDLFTISQSLKDTKKLSYGWYASVLSVKDTAIGHSTSFNVRGSDSNIENMNKSLLLNPNWNPYINRTDYNIYLLKRYFPTEYTNIKNQAQSLGIVIPEPKELGKLEQGETDIIVRYPISENFIVGIELEANYGRYYNRYGKVEARGYRGQLGIYLKPFEIGFRYAEVKPDKENGFKYYDASTNTLYPTMPQNTTDFETILVKNLINTLPTITVLRYDFVNEALPIKRLDRN